MKPIYAFPLMGAFLLTNCQDQQNIKLQSPDKQLSLDIHCSEEGVPTYTFQSEDTPILSTSTLGYRLPTGTPTWKITKTESDKERKVWKPLWGKRTSVPDEYNETTIHLENTHPESSSTLNKLTIQCRLYDDGLAFRYIVPERQSSPAEEELTSFNFATDPTAWFYNGEHANIGPIPLSEVNATRPSNVTLKLKENAYTHIHEAFLQEGDPLKLKSEKGSSTFHVASSPGAFKQLKEGFTSPWRVIMYAKTPGELVDSHMIELLNPNPSPEQDFSWVKPGVCVWDWRIDGAEWEGFTYGMNYESWVKMIDFATEQGIAHLVLDANWYGPEHEKDSNPVNGDKAKDVKRIIDYGKSKNVGVWVYLNDVGGKQFPIEETLKQYGTWGAAGVKYGFMSGSAEQKNIWTQKITQLCAENKLLVNFHDGPVHPYGQMRTWPNALTREYCHAQLDAHRVFTPSTFCTSVFVNMVAGPIDMNNGFFDLRQEPTTRVDEKQPVPTTLVAEAARTQIVFSGATVIPDIPEYYKLYPSLLRFISAQKMPWLESKTIVGEIGKFIVMARQSQDKNWLIGVATNEESRTLEIPLNFLPQGSFQAEITEDGDSAHYLTNKTDWKSSQKTVSSKDTLTVKLAPGGGACILLTPQSN